jgi:RsiW-degrading membrane proteinase PrsW (M82 family)
MHATAFVVSFLGGFIPALFWLWFWLREDRAEPEPKMLIASAFLAGMAVVAIALPLQKYTLGQFTDATLVFSWVVIEEILKYSAALIVVLWHKEVDEPIDIIIYMITIALGFAAVENALFIWSPLIDGQYTESILTGHFRFLGSTLLHVLASGTVGAAMALAYYKSKPARVLWSTLGLCVAIVLHTLFNFFIMDGNGETILTVFLFVWMGIIILFLVFEKVKLLEKTRAR